MFGIVQNSIAAKLTLSVMFLTLGLSQGFYTPVISNVLIGAGLGSEWIQRVFVAGSLGGALAPITVGALSDYRFSGQKLFGSIAMVSGVSLVLAFSSLAIGFSPWVFVGFFFVSKVIGGALWALIAAICLANLDDASRQFPLVRLGGTIGWMLAGWSLSWLFLADDSLLCGFLAGLVRIFGGGVALLLPNTPVPQTSSRYRDLLGFSALSLLARNRSFFVFFLFITTLSIPASAFYMHVPILLADIGVERIAALMSVSQLAEIVSMFFFIAWMRRYSVKGIFVLSTILLGARYGLFALSGSFGSPTLALLGVALHGAVFAVFHVTAQIFLHQKVEGSMCGQAQGLLAFFRGGVGAVLGVVFARHLNDFMIGAGYGWGLYWAVLACLTLVIGLCFSVTFREGDGTL